MNSTQTQEFTWKRQPTGEQLARHGFWVYTVYRDLTTRKGRQWVLKAWPEGNPDDYQVRTGFSSASTARQAATHTPCFFCGRRLPFGTLEPDQKDNTRLIVSTWRCRDHEQCQAERARISAESRARILEQRRKDHNEITVREAEYGPELVFTSGNSSTVINVTEGDLDKVAEVVWERRAAGAVKDSTPSDSYTRKLREIVRVKAHVRELETAALELRTQAISSGVPETEIRRAEHDHAGCHCQGPLDACCSPDHGE